MKTTIKKTDNAMKKFERIIYESAITVLLLVTCSFAGFSQQGLTLEQALKIAETNSPNMKITRLNLIRSQENLNAQNASLKSQFSVNLTPFSYTKSNEFNNLISDYNYSENKQASGSFRVQQPIKWSDATLSLTNKLTYLDNYSDYVASKKKQGFNNQLQISLDQPLFTYNRTKLALKELQLALENSQLNYAIQLLALEKSVTQGFYSVYQQQQSLEISKEAFVNMQKSYEVSQKIRSMPVFRPVKRCFRPN